MIKFENVGVVYPGGVKALDNINLEINEGDFVIIVGLSGAGKSTLLRSINNLVKPTDGNVFVDGKNVTNASKKELKNVLDTTKEKLVSIDFNHNHNSAIVDLSLTNVVGDNMGKVSAWYDNEWGFASRMCDLAEYIHKI